MEYDWDTALFVKMRTNRVTQRELAKEIGVSNTYLNGLLNGKRGPMTDEKRHRIDEAVNAILGRRKEA